MSNPTVTPTGDLEIAREAAAQECEAQGWYAHAKAIREGLWDKTHDIEARAARLALACQTDRASRGIYEFARLILHGDDEHRGWLIEAAEAYVAGKPMPAPRGKGTQTDPASPPTVPANWRCAECRCMTYACVQEQKANGSFGDSTKIRCVNCKLVEDLASPPVAVAGEVERLREEVAYWRRDLSARLFFLTCELKAAHQREDLDAVASASSRLRPALGSYHAAQDGEWHDRCDVCGEFVRPHERTLSGEDISGHARCLSDDDYGSVYPEGDEELAERAAEARAALNEKWPVEAVATAPDPDRLRAGDAGERVTLSDLHAANIARQAEWCPDQVPDLSFRGNELGGECGEALNVIKKLERERLGWRGSRDTVEHLAEELADVVICADLCAVTAGIDLDAAVVAKFNATSEKVGLSTRLTAASPPAQADEDDLEPAADFYTYKGPSLAEVLHASEQETLDRHLARIADEAVSRVADEHGVDRQTLLCATKDLLTRASAPPSETEEGR